MFQCSQCHTEYGGIRGITAERCPRCVSQDGPAAGERQVALTVGSADPWHAPQLAATSFSGPTAPLVGPIAQLDRAIRH